jgi:predicted transcriptional regulator
MKQSMLSFQCPEDIHKWLDDVAEIQGRSRSNVIVRILEAERNRRLSRKSVITIKEEEEVHA